MRVRPRSLRTKLMLAFVAVLAFSLALASGSFIVLLRDYQAEREKNRLESVAIATTIQVVRALRLGLPLDEVEGQLDQFAEASHARILLLGERDLVIRDTDANRLTGQQLAIPVGGNSRRAAFQGVLNTPDGQQVYAVAPLPVSSYRIAVVAPEQSLTSAWRELVPSLSVSALGSLLVSLALASWLALSITGPIVRITRASEEMARGQYSQTLDMRERDDEIGRLAKAFEGMARQVARSHQAMRDLLTNVSHDLRTPLTSIQGFATALVDGTLAGSDGAREAGRVIGEEADRMRHLVEELLDLGRIESGQLALDREEVDLSGLAAAAHRRFSRRAEEQGLSFAAQVSEPVPVLGDYHRLAQVLDNLVENALKHTPAGGSVRVETRVQTNRTERRGRVAGFGVISVANSGSYLSPEERDRVFDRFYQADPARSGAAGRGLGLAIAREIVQAHGGTIDVASTQNDGTTFFVRLPLVEGVWGPRLLSPDATQQSLGLGARPAG